LPTDRRDPAFQREFYSLFRPGNLFLLQQRERALMRCLSSAGVTRDSIEALSMLELGCGAGGLLPQLASYGADPNNLVGFDLDRSRIAEAARRHPAMHFFVGDATRLPVGDACFDVVIQSTLFTSILDREARRAAAAEMRRVLRPGGFILWLDFRYDSPKNPSVRRVSRRELTTELFPGCTTRLVRTMLVPPLARRVVPVSRFAAELLSLVPPLLTHYFGVIRPAGSRSPS
jgi:ubiquinone/menaquinone biosynthesis C-methylase UbiE